MPICNDLIKRRVIHFRRSSSEDTAERAAELLSAVEGVSNARIHSQDSLSIHYDIRVLSLQMIENALADVGFQLSGNVICRIKRELIAYCEDNLRESLQADAAASDEPHEHVDQATHDPRPYNWRNYS